MGKSDRDRRSELFSLRLSSEERSMLEQLARFTGLGMSDVIRNNIRTSYRALRKEFEDGRANPNDQA